MDVGLARLAQRLEGRGVAPALGQAVTAVAERVRGRRQARVAPIATPASRAVGRADRRDIGHVYARACVELNHECRVATLGLGEPSDDAPGVDGVVVLADAQRLARAHRALQADGERRGVSMESLRWHRDRPCGHRGLGQALRATVNACPVLTSSAGSSTVVEKRADPQREHFLAPACTTSSQDASVPHGRATRSPARQCAAERRPSAVGADHRARSPRRGAVARAQRARVREDDERVQEMLLEAAVLRRGVGIGEEVIVVVGTEDPDRGETGHRHERGGRVALPAHHEAALEHDLLLALGEVARVGGDLGTADVVRRALRCEHQGLGTEAQLAQRAGIGARQHQHLRAVARRRRGVRTAQQQHRARGGRLDFVGSHLILRFRVRAGRARPPARRARPQRAGAIRGR